MSAEVYIRLLGRCVTALQALPDKPEETPEATLRALWHTAAGMPMSAVLAAETELPPLDPDQVQQLESLLDRRIGGVPLAYLTARQRFCGLEFLAGPEALIPRQETELLARAATKLARQRAAEVGTVVMLDACTGAGNVALAVAAHEPAAQVWAADISEPAVELARRNAEHLGLAERVRFQAADLLTPFLIDEWQGRVDLITCNPPYISSAKVDTMPGEIREHEPRLAFDGGPFGVRILKRLIQEAPQLLRHEGWLAFEVGLGQGAAMARLLSADSNYDRVETQEDAEGQVRVVLARHAKKAH